MTQAQTARQLYYQHHKLRTVIGRSIARRVLWAGNVPLALEPEHGPTKAMALAKCTHEHTLIGMSLEHSIDPLHYSPWGYLRSSDAGPLIGFNGEQLDPFTTNYLLGNGLRAYSPVLMRFLSADILSPFKSGGINAYAYCSGDPVNYVDSSGRTRHRVLPVRSPSPKPQPIAAKPTALPLSPMSPGPSTNDLNLDDLLSVFNASVGNSSHIASPPPPSIKPSPALKTLISGHAIAKANPQWRRALIGSILPQGATATQKREIIKQVKAEISAVKALQGSPTNQQLPGPSTNPALSLPSTSSDVRTA